MILHSTQEYNWVTETVKEAYQNTGGGGDSTLPWTSILLRGVVALLDATETGISFHWIRQFHLSADFIINFFQISN